MAITTFALDYFNLNITVHPVVAGHGHCLRWNWRGAIGGNTITKIGQEALDAATLSNCTALCFDNGTSYSLLQYGPCDQQQCTNLYIVLDETLMGVKRLIKRPLKDG